MKTIFNKSVSIGFFAFMFWLFGFIPLTKAVYEPCNPNWGGWGMYVSPTLTGTCPPVADQCVSISAPNAEGGPVTASVTVTPTDGTLIRYDNNYCENPNYQTEPCDLSTPVVTWTASGCGADPASGSGSSASFNVNADGVASVTFTITATDCQGNEYTASASTSFNVYLNATYRCPVTTPNGGSFTLNNGGSASGTSTTTDTEGDTTDDSYNGTLTATIANYTYVNPENYSSGCGLASPLPNSLTLPSFDFGADIGTGVGPVDLGIDISYSEAQASYPIFSGCSPASYTKQYGTVWERKAVPVPPSFTGTLTETQYSNLGILISGPTTSNYSGGAYFINETASFVYDAYGSACCSVPCCPND